MDEQNDRLRIIETLDFPEGRDTPSTPGRRGPQSRPGSEPRDSQRSHAASVFASELAEKLQKGRTDGHFEELVLIAAPRFLGALRTALDPTTSAMVRGTLDKDYCRLNDRELLARLEKM